MNNDAVKELLNAVGALAEMSLNFLQSGNQFRCHQRGSLCSGAVSYLCLYLWKEGGRS